MQVDRGAEDPRADLRRHSPSRTPRLSSFTPTSTLSRQQAGHPLPLPPTLAPSYIASATPDSGRTVHGRSPDSAANGGTAVPSPAILSTTPNTANDGTGAETSFGSGTASAKSRPRPLCHNQMTSRDLQEGVVPVYDIDAMPGTEGRYKRVVENQGDYRPGGFARITLGDRLHDQRYEVIDKLGVGHYGVVYLCWDRSDGRHVAIKIVRSEPKYTRAASAEDRLLTVIQGPRDDRRDYIVQFLDSFLLPSWDKTTTHMCLVFEVLGMSLLEVLRRNDFKGLPLRVVQQVARQILQAVSYLHSLDIAHTDIKPDNIMLSLTDPEASIVEHLTSREQHDETGLVRAHKVVTVEDFLWPRPGLSEEENRTVALRKYEAEKRKWPIAASRPIPSSVEFVRGHMLEPQLGNMPSSAVQREVGTLDGDAGAQSPDVMKAERERTTTEAESSISFEESSLDRISLAANQLKLPEGALHTEHHPLDTRPARLADEKHAKWTAIPQPVSSNRNRNEPPFSAALAYDVGLQVPATRAGSLWDHMISEAGPLADTLQSTARMAVPETRISQPLVLGDTHNHQQMPSPVADLVRDFALLDHGLADFQQDPDEMLEMKRKPLYRTGSQSSYSSTYSSNSGNTSPRSFTSFREDIRPFDRRWEQAKLPRGSAPFGSPLTRRPHRSSFDQPEMKSKTERQSPALTRSSSASSNLSAWMTSHTSLAGHGQRLVAYQSLSGSPGASRVPGSELAQVIEESAMSTVSKASSPASPNYRRSSSHSSAFDQQALLEMQPTETGSLQTSPVAEKVELGIKVKLADLGNAIFFSEARTRSVLPKYVCTRQYRPPENIIGADFDESIDVWAVGCVIYEILTGDLLFNPTGDGKKYSKEEDLLSQQLEMFGPFPSHFLERGRMTPHFFRANGRLRRLKVQPWPLKDVLMTKYHFPESEAQALTDFLQRLLEPDPAKRIKAEDALELPWLNTELTPEAANMVAYREPPPKLVKLDENAVRQQRAKAEAEAARYEEAEARWRGEISRVVEERHRREDEAQRRSEEERQRRFWQMRFGRKERSPYDA